MEVKISERDGIKWDKRERDWINRNKTEIDGIRLEKRRS